jgi:predicted HicB family RNase H-like nuclease
MKDNKQNARLQNITDILNTQSTEPQIQMVVAVPAELPEVPATKSESQLNVEIRTEIIDRLKFHGLRTRKSLKQLVAEALSQYLDNVEKTM